VNMLIDIIAACKPREPPAWFQPNVLVPPSTKHPTVNNRLLVLPSVNGTNFDRFSPIFMYRIAWLGVVNPTRYKVCRGQPRTERQLSLRETSRSSLRYMCWTITEIQKVWQAQANLAVYYSITPKRPQGPPSGLISISAAPVRLL